jgi:L-amino acid N-acyltransferase YncA
MLIRDALATDIPAITAIYNSVLLTSTAIYNDQPVTVEDRFAYWQSRTAQGYPLLVAVDDSDDSDVLGYATFGDFRPWPGYRFTIEGTIHLREGARSQGIGSQLLHHLVERACALGKHTLIAGVDSENQASIRFLERSGFLQCGRLREVGYKFGRFLDLVFLQRSLSAPAAPPVETSSDA